MISGGPNRKAEKGAALIVVLLLIATLSFILLSITNVVTAAVRRSAADRARTDFYWRAAAGELVAREILEKYLATNPAKMAPGEGIFAKPVEVPIEGGKASIGFRDATLCFNVNSLVAGGPGEYAENPPAIEGFTTMLEALGLGSGEADKLADVIVDFMDNDALSRGQGAEDGFYSALPTPYRTSGQLIKSMSELRAMDGVTRSLYRRIRPYLCALDGTSMGTVNINMARRDRSETSLDPAPALLGYFPASAGVTMSELRNLLEAIPPGGLADRSVMDPALAAVPEFALVSDRIEAVITLEVNDLAIEERLLFETKSGTPPKLLARTFGDDY